MWQLSIQDPSGETRTFPLRGEHQAGAVLGRGNSATILLRDPTLPQEAAVLWVQDSHYWIKVPNASVAAYLGDLPVRESQLPSNLPIRLGETTFVLEKTGSTSDLPPFPSGTRPWLTAAESGKKILWTAKKAAATPLSIYIAGETGTGKEVIAHLLHSWSERASGPFVPINCGALPLSLAESELFGHVKGAFTGAVSHRPGALMQAHSGTLFLDEIGDLPMDIQVKLLRFLENGEIRAVGSDRPSKADVRLLCATHQPLRRFVEEGKFRRDLYYRLASVTIEIPTLRSRAEDIELLATRFASEFNRTLSEKALLRLKAYGWPGNVRELRHAIERGCGLASPFEPTLGEEAFDFLLRPDTVEESPELELGTALLSLDEMERAMLLKALRLSQGNRSEAAKILGVARSTLFEMLKRHKIQGPRMQKPQFGQGSLRSPALVN